MQVVISQSMYFPWVGLLEQVRLAEVFIHYDDVQFTRGFYNRVQVKMSQGVKWMTVPLQGQHRGQCLDEILIDDRMDWRSRHRDMLRQAYLKAPFLNEMLALADEVFSCRAESLADLSRASMISLINYFGLAENRDFLVSNDLGVGGKSSHRLFDLVRRVGGNVYVTGHGARNYLDHCLFENAGIDVRYMQYRCLPYPQLHGKFTPYVTGLDLVANCGREGSNYIVSEAVNWREFIHGSA